MKYGFIKAAAGTPDVRVADCEFNATEIIRMVHEMEEQGAKVMVFPELCITAYTCGDLFWQEKKHDSGYNKHDQDNAKVHDRQFPIDFSVTFP